jgi:hypothetical protein
MSLEPRHDRRELLRRLGRLGLLLGLSASGLTLAVRRPGPPPPACADGCRGCAALRGCALPAAAAFRREGRA